MQEENDLSYLMNVQPSQVDLMNISELGEKLKQLKVNQLIKEAEAEQAKKEYEHFANTVVPQQMAALGIESISLSTGGSLSLKRNFYCSPNKNEEDMKEIRKFLKKYNGEEMIEESGEVSAEDFSKLKDSDIPYIEKLSINTNRLKAFLTAGIGASKKSTVQRFTIEDIPKCIHFQEVLTVDVSTK